MRVRNERDVYCIQGRGCVASFVCRQPLRLWVVNFSTFALHAPDLRKKKQSGSPGRIGYSLPDLLLRRKASFPTSKGTTPPPAFPTYCSLSECFEHIPLIPPIRLMRGLYAGSRSYRCAFGGMHVAIVLVEEAHDESAKASSPAPPTSLPVFRVHVTQCSVNKNAKRKQGRETHHARERRRQGPRR